MLLIWTAARLPLEMLGTRFHERLPAKCFVAMGAPCFPTTNFQQSPLRRVAISPYSGLDRRQVGGLWG